MQEEQETVQQDTETQATDAQGITADQTTDSPDVTVGSESSDQVSDGESQVDPEQLKKELEKTRMELNQKRNKLDEYEKQREEQRKAELSEVDRLKEELAEAKAKEEQRELSELRDSFIEDYSDPATVKAAKALLKHNPNAFVWGSATTTEEAKAQIHEQLDALKGNIGVLESEQEDQEQPQINGNNPPSPADPSMGQFTNMDSQEMRKVLESEGLVAPSR